MEILPGDYIAGFVDGEGCFALNFRRDVRHERKNKPIYFIWKPQFAIVLRSDDIEILERIKNTLGCGNIIKTETYARYQVSNVSDLANIIVPFFEKNHLQAKKRHDFELWKEGVILIARNKRTEVNVKKGQQGFLPTEWNTADLARLKEIKKAMKPYKGNVKQWKWIQI